MFTTLALSGLLLLTPAQAPRAGGAGGLGGSGFATSAPADTSPRIVEIKPDASGKIKITVTRPKPFKPPAMAGFAGGNFPAIMVPTPESVDLAAVKNLKITTTAGKEVKIADAVKTLAKGGFVLVSSDGKNIPTAILHLFNQEVLVLVSPELARTAGMNGIMMGAGGAGGGGGIGIPLQPAPKGN
jgi:hypothetical protein